MTLRESAQYGVSMFPDTGETKRKGGGVDDDDMDVADRIVMERARVRRKELAEEEKVEEEILAEERAAQRAKARDSRREKALERAQQTRESKTRAGSKVQADTSEASETNAMRRARRGTRQRAVMNDSESDAMSVDSLVGRQSVQIAKKGVRGDGVKAVRVTSQVISSDSDSVEFVGDLGHKARNRKSKTSERSMDPDTHVSIKTIAARERATFSVLASLASDEEHKGTPRPTRGRKINLTTAETTTGSSNTLQIARNRPGAR